MTTERVDTRVLQVIYALDSARSSVYVGQQMDVFIDAKEAGEVIAMQSVKPSRSETGSEGP